MMDPNANEERRSTREQIQTLEDFIEDQAERGKLILESGPWEEVLALKDGRADQEQTS